MPDASTRGNRCISGLIRRVGALRLQGNRQVEFHSAGRNLPERKRDQPAWIKGQNSAIRPRVMIVLTRPLEKNTPSPPCEDNSDWRNASSALSPSTIASTIGANG